MPERWSYFRWLRESRAYMRRRPAWEIYWLATLKWPAFNRKQRDARKQWDTA
jgi:hypothetical protein